MEQNASSMPTPANQLDSPRNPRALGIKSPMLIVIFIIFTSVLASSVYFFYTRIYEERQENPAQSQQLSVPDQNIGDDWEQFTFSEASISFYHPKDLTALEIPSGLSISKEGEIILEIQYGKTGSRSLSEFVATTTPGETNTTRIREKVGLSRIDGSVDYRYFPGFLDDYVLLKVNGTDPETNELVETIIQTIEFLPPQTANL